LIYTKNWADLAIIWNRNYKMQEILVTLTLLLIFIPRALLLINELPPHTKKTNTQERLNLELEEEKKRKGNSCKKQWIRLEMI
jgi:hypothetical protein